MKTKLFHATEVANVAGIMKEGIKTTFGEVYLTDSPESGVRWLSIRPREKKEIAVIEVEVEESELEEGVDHSPLLVEILNVGKSIVCPRTIKPEEILSVNIYEYGE